MLKSQIDVRVALKFNCGIKGHCKGVFLVPFHCDGLGIRGDFDTTEEDLDVAGWSYRVDRADFDFGFRTGAISCLKRGRCLYSGRQKRWHRP